MKNEKKIRDEAGKILENPELKLIDLHEWSSDKNKIIPYYNETLIHLPGMEVYLVVPIECDKRLKE